jgi:hypothetical protein
MPDQPRKDNRLRPVQVVFDSFEGGMNDRDHPSDLKPNQYAYGRDIEIRESGLYKTRRGKNAKASSSGAQPQGIIYYEPLAGSGMLVIVNQGKIWRWSGSGTTLTRVDASVTLSNTSNRVRMVILNRRLYIFSGSGSNVRSWDGASATLTDEGNTNTDPPRGDIAIVAAGRIVAAGTGDNVNDDQNYYSDIDDGQTWSRSANILNSPTDGTEAITALATYRKEEHLSFTRNSSHYFDASGATVTAFSRTTLDPTIGTVSPLSVVVIGEDAFFLSSDAQVRTVKRTVQDIAYGVSLPVTALVPNLMARVNKTYMHKAAGIYFDNYYLLAVPLDDSHYNNGVIVFDMLHQQQLGGGSVPVCLGEWTNINCHQWVISNFSGKQELYYLDSLDGSLYQMFTIESDDGTAITSIVQTRSANWGEPRKDKTVRDGEVDLEDTYGTISISYAKDDQVFTSLISNLSVGSANPSLPIVLPFTLGSGGVLQYIPFGMWRTGRSRNWQLQITHTSGVVNMKAAALAACIENVRTRNL